MEIFEIPPEDRRDFMELLLLADESEAMISRYIGRGRMFVLTVWGEAAAECLVTDEGGGVLEIQSIAVAPEHVAVAVHRAHRRAFTRSERCHRRHVGPELMYKPVVAYISHLLHLVKIARRAGMPPGPPRVVITCADCA